MMKVNFALFRLFERVVPINRTLFRNVHAVEKIFWRLGLEINLHITPQGFERKQDEFRKREFRIRMRNSLALQSKKAYNKVDICSRRSNDMAISYNKLWKLLVDKKMSKADLRKAAGIAPNTMTRLRRDEEVTLTVLHKICKTLDVDIGDIMEFLPDAEDEPDKK